MPNKLEGLQIARGIAALAVVLFHSQLLVQNASAQHKWIIPYFSLNGSAGVWLFFVISGFIIAKSLAASDFSFKVFVIRRIFRIYPLYIVATLVAFWLQIQFDMPFYWPDSSPSYVLKSALIIPMETPPFYQPGWTLEHELIFYFLSAILFLFIPLWGTAIVLFVLGFMGAFFGDQLFHVVNLAQTYFGMGMLLFIFREKLAGLGCAFPLIVFVSMETLVISFGLPSYLSPLLRSFGMASLCLALLNAPISSAECTKFGRALVVVFVSFGNISYSIYIVHWAVLRIFIWIRTTHPWPAQDTEAVRWSMIALSLALSFAVYRWLELPSNHIGRRISDMMAKSGHSVLRRA